MEDIPVITIDGPSGAGKGSVAHFVARNLGWNLLDSGAIYRTVAFAAEREKIDINNSHKLIAFIFSLKIDMSYAPDSGFVIFYNKIDVTHDIRTELCAKMASKISALLGVRKVLLDLQHRLCRSPGLVADGRDMGSVVFPHARLKIFLTASIAARAARRYKQLQANHLDVTLSDCADFFSARDKMDAEREVSALKPAPDAVIIDNSDHSLDETCVSIMAQVKQVFTLN